MRQIGFEHHLELWNQTHQPYSNENVIQLFEKIAVELPNKTACIFQDKFITYGELNKRANQIAHYITKQDKTNSPIAIYIDRSIEVVVSFLAVLKTGRPYIPIDVDVPSMQFMSIIGDANASLILTTLGYVRKISDTTDILTIIDVNQHIIFHEQETNLPAFPANNLAYILYTSGTTGKPKGVQISHRSIVNLLCSMVNELQIKEHDEVFLGITPFTFDLSVPDIYLPLISGGQIVLAAPMARYSPGEIVELLNKFNISIMQATPTTWQMLVTYGWTNKTDIKIISGGEAFTNQLASNLLELSNKIWNFYGPTEATVWSTCHRLKTIDKNLPYIPVGKPLANTQIYILDKDRQPVAADTPGELYIGGDGVSPGYLNNTKLNQQSFINSPFPSSVGKLYKTGDLVKWTMAGELEYLGRIDTQIKLHGYRIEVEAIENTLQEFPGIAQCIVHDKTPDSRRELSAYLILKIQQQECSAEQLQNYLRKHFPNYMIPSKFYIVDKFPLTANGKINRKSISSVSNYRELLDEITPLRNFPIENVINELLEKILNRDVVHPGRNFFNLGMNSLLLVELAEHLSKSFKQTISVIDLFAYPTVRSLAEFLSKLISNQQTAEHTSHTTEQKIADDIAVIGMSCKFPGASNPKEFWSLILQKTESIQFFDEHELQQAGVRLSLIEHPDYVPARGVTAGIDQFDAAFFGYSPAEARLIDPQHRVFLETAWTAL